ncbi:hypothetical protein MMC25_004105 [Agyrium rufum]|nr:hypothetical protein [Agyrium rufum]
MEMMSVSDRLRYLDVNAQWLGAFREDPSIPKGQIRLLRSPTLTQHMWSVEEYNRRNLSFPQDIINAFAGIQKVLEVGFHSDFWHGLPVEHLEQALLWKHTEIFKRRTDSSGHAPFPSWSWAGWIGPIRHSTLYPRGNRHHDEERIRPLLHWYRWNKTTGLVKIPRHWETSRDLKLQLDPEVWLPLHLPADFLIAPSRISDELLLYEKRLYFRAFTARLKMGNLNDEGREGSSAPTSVDILDTNGAWVGLANMSVHVDASSSCEFLIISEAQWVGLHKLDQTYRAECDHYRYFNVLAVAWNENVATLIGIGRIRKEAWADAKAVCRDVVLG